MSLLDIMEFGYVRNDSLRLEVFAALSKTADKPARLEICEENDQIQLAALLNSLMPLARSSPGAAKYEDKDRLPVHWTASPDFLVAELMARDESSGEGDKTLVRTAFKKQIEVYIAVSDITSLVEDILQVKALEHPNNTVLFAVFFSPSPKRDFLLCEFSLERAPLSLLTDISLRKKPYSEAEFLHCFLHVTRGLLHAKSKVILTQGISHRSLSFDVIQLTAGGNYKVCGYMDSPVTYIKDRDYLSWSFISNLLKERGIIENLSPFQWDVIALGMLMYGFACGKIILDATSFSSSLSSEAANALREAQYSTGLQQLVTAMLRVEKADLVSLEYVSVELAKIIDSYPPLRHLREERNEQVDLPETADTEELERIEKLLCEYVAALKQQGLSAALCQTNIELAKVYMRQERLAEAETVCKEILVIVKSLYRKQYPARSQACSILYSIYMKMGKGTEAEEARCWGKYITSSVNDLRLNNTAIDFNIVSMRYQLEGRLQDAERLCIKAISSAKKYVAKDDYKLVFSYLNLSTIFYLEGRSFDAEATYEDAIKLWMEKSKYQLNVHFSKSYATVNCLKAGSCVSNEQLSKLKSLSTVLENCPASYCLAFLLYQSSGEISESIKEYMKALSLDEMRYGREHWVVTDKYHILSRLFSSTRQLQQAKEACLHALSIEETLYESNSSRVAEGYIDLGILCTQLQQWEEVEAACVKAINIQTQKEQYKLALSYTMLSYAQRGQERLPDAEQTCRRALLMQIKYGKCNLQESAQNLGYLSTIQTLRKLHSRVEEAVLHCIQSKKKLFVDKYRLQVDVKKNFNDLRRMYAEA